MKGANLREKSKFQKLLIICFYGELNFVNIMQLIESGEHFFGHV